MHTYSWSRSTRPVGSELSRTIADVFGLTESRFESVPVLADVPVPTGGLTYVTGYSGTGKSVLLSLFLADNPEAHVPAEPEPGDDRPLVELFELPLAQTLSLLGQVGLGEAFCYLTPYHLLSDGQRARARLALAYAGGHRLLVVDEFLSTLDRTSAAVVAYGFQKFCRRNGVSAVVATAHDDLERHLGPDHTIVLDYNGSFTFRPVAQAPSAPFKNKAVVRRGDMTDYQALERFHYMGGLDVPPEAFDTDVWVVEVEGKVAGVKVLSTPYPRSWSRHRVFREVNEALTIARRTVVHPAFRSAGVAVMLCDPGLAARPVVFIRSALGRFQPFPLRAGYREVDVDTAEGTELATTAAGLIDKRVAAEELSESDIGMLRGRCAEMLLAEYGQYRELGGLPQLEGVVLDSVRTWFERCAGLGMTGQQLIDAVRPFPMAGFVFGGPLGTPDSETAPTALAMAVATH